ERSDLPVLHLPPAPAEPRQRRCDDAPPGQARTRFRHRLRLEQRLREDPALRVQLDRSALPLRL
ncbi:MAG: hypothetical protein AVDCRST_MAG71-1370, partial [uncultured Lysobacter sp.]